MIHLKRSEETLDNIKQYYVWCPSGDDGKYTALINIYGILTIGQCIVFCHVSFCVALMMCNYMQVTVHCISVCRNIFIKITWSDSPCKVYLKYLHYNYVV